MFRPPVGREFRQLLQWAGQVNQVGLAGVVQQAPKRILGQTESADVDGVLGDRIELRGVATKPTLVRQRMGNVPDLVGPLVIVDSLPFLAAIMNPDATAESVKAQAEQMRKMYSGPPAEQTEKMGEMAVKAMVTSPADFEMIMGWSRKATPSMT